MTTVINREATEVVLYHGSQTRMHGEWLLAGPCICDRCVARVLSGADCDRWELADVRGPQRITCVRRESFTPCSEIPAAEPAPEHKTRTSQPTGYQYGADGSRMTHSTGRLMRDGSSYWFCTCEVVGAGATREEARSRARQHREQESACEQARFDAAVAALRAKLQGAAA